MKISNQWLCEWVDHGLSVEELGHRLTMAGLELDALDPAAPPFSGVVVGYVLAVSAHPDAEKLRVCHIEEGGGEPVQVVCGAPNVVVGMRVPFARVGAKLPGGLDIRKAKLRGVESFGMLCSARELGLSEDAQGLMALPADAPTGADLREYLGLDDTILELGLTPNRADCLGVAGIAREVGVLTRHEVGGPECQSIPAAIEDTIPVTLEAASACPRYCGRVIRGIDPRAPTPLWMRERLRRVGIRSIGALVDVTNYVLIELGQPMHAFDLSLLQGGLRVRMARTGESLTLLDGQAVELEDDTLVIADDRGALAMAGIMGGEGSGVTDTTLDVFLESAFFAPLAIAGRARRHGLHTDSSHRFERGVDPDGQRRAIERATTLILDIAGGRAGPVIEAVSPEHLPARPVIHLRAGRIDRLLGIEIPDAEVTDILSRLGCAATRRPDGWDVTPPSWRFDLAIEPDLIEEIARVHGYDKIPAMARPLPPMVRPRPEAAIRPSRLRSLLVDRGYQEAITFSFVDEQIESLLAPLAVPLRLANPISADLSQMRTTLWSGLLRAMQHNLNRQAGRVRLFETGLSFVRRGEDLVQSRKIAGVICGSALPEQWGDRQRQADFFDLKGDVEAMLSLAGLDRQVSWLSAEHPALHPGQSTTIELNGQVIGRAGSLHPRVAEDLDLGRQVLMFELDLDAITRGSIPKFSEISSFPAIRRDIALIVSDSIPAARILECVRTGAPEWLRDCFIFDVYAGESIGSARKSIALGLILQDLSCTLTAEQVDEAVAAIVDRLGKDVGASLRV